MFLLAVSSPAQAQNAEDRARLDELEQQVKELKISLNKDRAETARHHVSGYLQTRFDTLVGSRALFNNSGSGGSGPRPTNGGPFVGGPSQGFLVRRGRLKLDGPVNERDRYTVQLDFGNVGAVNLRDAFVDWKSSLPKNTLLRLGQFAPPFGYVLPGSSRTRESPERPLGFSDSSNAATLYKSAQSPTAGEVTAGSVLPLFLNQDRDQGAALLWSLPKLAKRTSGTLTYGVFNGEGRDSAGQRNLGAGLTGIARAEAVRAQPGGALSVGASVYQGGIPVRSGAAMADGKPAPFVRARRDFQAVDARWVAKNHAELRAEYLSGTFEATPDRARILPGNKVASWYMAVREPLTQKVELSLVYDEFRPTNQTVAGVGAKGYGRKTVQFGVLRQLAPNTRLRLWYAQGLSPFDPSAASGSLLRHRVGLFSTELQVEY